MTTYNTGNPLGSTNPKDLYDNAQNVDNFVNGSEPFYPDRFNQQRRSWDGMEYDFDNAQSGREAAFVVSQADKEDRFQDFLLSSGYQSLGAYAAGITFTARNQYVEYLGQFYRPSSATALPFTTTGTWASDSTHLVLLGDEVLRQDLANSSDVTKGATLIGFRSRTLRKKLEDSVSVKDFGAVGDGVTDDSAAFTAALAFSNTVHIPYGLYSVKNITIGTNQTLIGDGSIIRPALGASYAFKLTGFRPWLTGCYFDDQLDRVTHGIGTNAVVIVENSAYPVVDQCWFVNVFAGLLLKTSAINTTLEVTKGQFTNLRFDTVISRGIFVGPNVNTCTFDQIRMYVGVEMPDNRPRRGCVGFQLLSTGSLLAFGGHMLSKIDVEQAEYGFIFTDATLSYISQCFADSLANTGFQVAGASSNLKFNNCLAGTCLRGFEVSTTATSISLDSIETIYQGVVPPWWVGPGAFYVAGSPFDVFVGNTAAVKIGSWFGDHKLYADPGVSITFDSKSNLYSGTLAALGAGTTSYLGPLGASATDDLGFVADRAGVIYGIIAQCSAAPGASQSFTYTVMLNGVAQTVAATISGAAAFQGTGGNYAFFTAGQYISIRAVTSGGAAVTKHRASVTIKYF